MYSPKDGDMRSHGHKFTPMAPAFASPHNHRQEARKCLVDRKEAAVWGRGSTKEEEWESCPQGPFSAPRRITFPEALLVTSPSVQLA